MNLKSPRMKLAGVLIVLLVILLFSRSLPPSRSEQQQGFDKWLEAKEKVLNEISAHALDETRGARLNAADPMPVLTLQFVNQKEAGPASYKLVTTGSSKSIEKALRLLQLMREADLFSIGDRSDFSRQSERYVLVTVQDGDTLFKSSIREGDLGGNMQALLLLKLFKEFAEPPALEELTRP
jgi:hypothetical protein